MKLSRLSLSPLVAFLFVFTLLSQAGFASAAGRSGKGQDTVSKVVEINRQALAQIQAGKYEAAREALWAALGVLADANMGGYEIAARIHVYLAAVYSTGFNDTDKAIRQLVMALKIDPNVTITPRVETAALDDAFDAARSQVGLAPQEKETAAVPAPTAEVEPVAEKGATPTSEISDPWKDTSGDGSAAPSVAPRARKANFTPYEDLGEPSDAGAYTPEHGHLGLVLGMAKGFGLGGPNFAYGLRGGLRIRPIEIGFLVSALSALGQFNDQFGSLTAYAILFPLNVIIKVNSIFSLFVGGQLGLVYYRRRIHGGSVDPFFDEMAHGSAFAAGSQAGGAVRLSSRWSLRFELAWFHADATSVSATKTYPDGGYDTYGEDLVGRNFLDAYGAFCLTL